MAAKPLTDLQQRFVQQYLIQPSATAAYIAAGYKARGHAAEVNAGRLLRNAEVKAAIAAAREARRERVEVTQDWVIDRLVREAKRFRTGTHAARVSALHLLGKHLGMFGDKVEVTSGDAPDLTKLKPDDRARLLASLRSVFAPGAVGGPGA